MKASLSELPIRHCFCINFAGFSKNYGDRALE